MTKEEFCEALGEEIKRLREAGGMTQEELAAIVGIHRNSVRRYELGADMPVMLFVQVVLALSADAGAVLGRVLKER